MLRFKLSPIAMAVMAISFTAPAAHAVTAVSSSAYGLGADLTVLNLVTASVGPIGPSGGAAPSPYSDTNTVASVADTLDLTLARQGLNTGVIDTSASSPFPVTPTGTASATVDGLATSLKALGLGPTFLTLGATTVTSTSSVSGVGVLSAVGSSDIENLTLGGTALGGLTIDGSLYAHATPNTVLLNLAGLEIILNEQIPSGNGVTSKGIQTNAIDVMFHNFALSTGILNGDIIVSHSQAGITGPAVTAAPEPAAWAELLAGFAIVGGFARRRVAKTI